MRDDYGEIIAEGSFITPSVQLLTGKFPAAGKYKVLIVADSTTEGRYLSDVRFTYLWRVARYSIFDTHEVASNRGDTGGLGGSKNMILRAASG